MWNVWRNNHEFMFLPIRLLIGTLEISYISVYMYDVHMYYKYTIVYYVPTAVVLYTIVWNKLCKSMAEFIVDMAWDCNVKCNIFQKYK